MAVADQTASKFAANIAKADKSDFHMRLIHSSVVDRSINPS
jgi:hypothetical protein